LDTPSYMRQTTLRSVLHHHLTEKVVLSPVVSLGKHSHNSWV